MKLNQLGAERLEFVVLTHPHTDHYSGLLEVLCAYEGRVGAFYSYQALLSRDLLRAFALKAVEKITPTDSRIRLRTVYELVSLFDYLDARQSAGHLEWCGINGQFAQIAADGFPGVSFRFFIPSPRENEIWRAAVTDGSLLNGEKSVNELSLGLAIDYGGNRVLLCGDGTVDKITNITSRPASRNMIAARFVKLPHHGSRHNNTATVLDRLFIDADDRPRMAIISAQGTKHPDAEVLQRLRQMGVKPYCTGLARMCLQAPQISLPSSANVFEPGLSSLIDGARDVNAIGSACQGDIMLRLFGNGQFDIHRSTGVACWLRGEVPVPGIN